LSFGKRFVMCWVYETLGSRLSREKYPKLRDQNESSGRVPDELHLMNSSIKFAFDIHHLSVGD